MVIVSDEFSFLAKLLRRCVTQRLLKKISVQPLYNVADCTVTVPAVFDLGINLALNKSSQLLTIDTPQPIEETDKMPRLRGIVLLSFGNPELFITCKLRMP